MSRKFSLAYLTIPGTDPVKQIEIAKKVGYDFVSLRTIPMHLPNEPEFLLHKDKKLFEATKQALNENDMPLMDIELARKAIKEKICDKSDLSPEQAANGIVTVVNSNMVRAIRSVSVEKGYDVPENLIPPEYVPVQ